MRTAAAAQTRGPPTRATSSARRSAERALAVRAERGLSRARVRGAGIFADLNVDALRQARVACARVIGVAVGVGGASLAGVHARIGRRCGGGLDARSASGDRRQGGEKHSRADRKKPSHGRRIAFRRFLVARMRETPTNEKRRRNEQLLERREGHCAPRRDVRDVLDDRAHVGVRDVGRRDHLRV